MSTLVKKSSSNIIEKFKLPFRHEAGGYNVW